MDATNTSAAARIARSNRRAWWMKQLRTWHWISGALCLIATLMFAVTGFTLNHASQIEGKPTVTTKEGVVPEAVLAQLKDGPEKGRAAIPAPVVTWIASQFGADAGGREAEWSDGEIYVSLTRPGGDGWVSIDRESGEAKYERSDRVGVQATNLFDTKYYTPTYPSPFYSLNVNPGRQVIGRVGYSF